MKNPLSSPELMSDSQAILVFDADGMLQSACERACHYFGLRGEGQSWSLTEDAGLPDCIPSREELTNQTHHVTEGVTSLEFDGHRWYRRLCHTRDHQGHRLATVVTFYRVPLERESEQVLSRDTPSRKDRSGEDHVGLERPEHRLRAVLDSMLGFVGELDVDGTILDLNQASLDTADLTREEVIGKPLWELYWCRDDAELVAEIRQAVGRAAKGETVRFDVVIRVAGNRRMWIDCMLQPIFDAHGRVVRIVQSGTDITDSTSVRRTEERRAAYARGLFESNPDCVMLLDSDGGILEINENGCELLELDDPSQVVGRSWASLWPDPTLAREATESARGGRKGHFQAFGPTRKGTEKWWDVIVVRVANPEADADALLAVSRDITEQHSSQLAIRERERRLQQMADAMPQLVWTASRHGVVDYYNSRATQYSGLSQKSDGSWDWAPLVHPEDRQPTEAAWRRSASTLVPYQHEHRICTADGSYRWHLSRAVPIEGESGEVRWIGTATDIHDVKLAEQSIRDSKERLAVALDAAEAANRSRGEFLANMSHEIRTPMAAILGYADLLTEHLDDPDNLQCVETIRRNGNFLLEIINDILDLSKIDAGKMIIEPESIRPEAILEDVMSLMQVRASEKRVNLKLEIESKLPETIQTDGKRLRQILVNLVGNAIKFTDRGTVRLICRLRPRTEEIRFEIVDTGMGISPANQEKLFQPFTQGDASSTRTAGGTGLGLTISRRLATLLGGDITVKSEVGRGSTFTVTVATGSLDHVRLITPSTTGVRNETNDDQFQHLHGRVLIVDDRREIRFLAQHFLEEAGCEIETANDGCEALELVHQRQGTRRAYDLMVLDMQMPVMDGYETARVLKREGSTMPIIALTANAMKGDREKCLEAGCTDFATKPLDKRVLLRLVSRYLPGPE